MENEILTCKGCKACFDSLSNLNRHIGRTGCGGGQLYDVIYEVELAGGRIEIKDIRYKLKKHGVLETKSLLLDSE